MRDVQIINRDHPLGSPLRAGYCVTYWCKLKGLSLRKTMPPDWGLLMAYNGESRIDLSIHMLWMNFDLGIIWIDAKGKVVDARLARRWRSFFLPSKPAKYVLEILPERFEEFHAGDEISFEEIN